MLRGWLGDFDALGKTCVSAINGGQHALVFSGIGLAMMNGDTYRNIQHFKISTVDISPIENVDNLRAEGLSQDSPLEKGRTGT